MADYNIVCNQKKDPLQSPPGSVIGSPDIKREGVFLNDSKEPTLVQNRLNVSQCRLPSIGEFVQGVEKLAQMHGTTNSWTPPSPLHSSSQTVPVLENIRRSHQVGSYLAPEDPYYYDLTGHHLPSTLSAARLDPHCQPPSVEVNQLPPVEFNQPPSVAFYPSPPPEGENRHINQKYTAEQGDFIIYAWHDRKIKWQRIKQEYAVMFGTTPERTVQGLQAWYYRMNLRIPVWDKDGWLCFENEDDLEPKHVSIKCRGQDKPMEPLGLAQRYPERAIQYAWVDPELKRRAQDWAAKREFQYRERRERRERRKRKEQRRLKL